MGYNTSYNLEFETPNLEEAAKWEEELLDISMDMPYKHVSHYLAQMLDSSCEPSKWYYLEDEIIEFSKQVPHIHFKITGYGEENEDMWICWIKDGKSIQATVQITWPTFEQLEKGEWPSELVTKYNEEE